MDEPKKLPPERGETTGNCDRGQQPVAFPNPGCPTDYGITVREYFIAAALQGTAGARDAGTGRYLNAQFLAQRAISIVDEVEKQIGPFYIRD